MNFPFLGQARRAARARPPSPSNDAPDVDASGQVHLSGFVDAVMALAAGKPVAPGMLERQDAPGAALRAVAELSERAAGAERHRQDADRYRQIVDQLPIAVVVANAHDDFRITYVNPCTVETLKPLRHLISRDPERLIGESIDVFHRHPQHQRRMLSDDRNLPHRAHIRLGPETLDLRVSAIRDAVGAYLGPMLTWSVVTGQVKLADDFERDIGAVIEGLGETAGQIRNAAVTLGEVARNGGDQANAVAAASSEATGSVESLATAAEELSASVAEINRQVTESARVANEATRDARASDATVEKLRVASSRIGEVVKVIDEIAGKTSLLALNATIEAARAGAVGRGFAVVASEVKSLASHTTNATREIATQVAEIQSATDATIAAISTIGVSVEQAGEIATAISAAVDEQDAATREIARNAAEAAHGTASVATNVSGLARAASETGASAGSMLQRADALMERASDLKRAADGFLANVRKL